MVIDGIVWRAYASYFLNKPKNLHGKDERLFIEAIGWILRHGVLIVLIELCPNVHMIDRCREPFDFLESRQRVQNEALNILSDQINMITY